MKSSDTDFPFDRDQRLSPAAITIDKAENKDIPELIVMLSDMQEITYRGIIRDDTIAMRQSFLVNGAIQRDIDDKALAFYIARDSRNRIVGVITAGSSNNINHIHIERLFIRPEVQKRGIGKKLISRVLDRYPHAEALELSVDLGNLPAISFYCHIGFVPQQPLKGDPNDQVLMIKYLS